GAAGGPPGPARRRAGIGAGWGVGTGHHGRRAGWFGLARGLGRGAAGAGGGEGRASPGDARPPGEPRPRSPRGRSCPPGSRLGLTAASRADESETGGGPREPHPEPIARALDLGTGSGILAIAAARLGVAEVPAGDTDPGGT